MIDGIKSKFAIIGIVIDGLYINYKGLYIRPNANGFTNKLDGSVHVFHNNGKHNADDYRMSDFLDTLNQMCEELVLNPDTTPLSGFEFGVNLKLPIAPDHVVESLKVFKVLKGGKYHNTDEGKGKYKKFEYTDYSLKVYTKSKSENILRIEIKVKNKKYWQKKGYVMLSDLLSVEVWKEFENRLTDAIGECLFIEDLTTEEYMRLSDKEKRVYTDYTKQKYWIERHNKDRRRYSEERSKCEAFLRKHSASTLKQDLINWIIAKCEELRDIPDLSNVVKKWDVFQVFQENENVKKPDVFHDLANGQNTISSSFEDIENPPKTDVFQVKIKSENVRTPKEQPESPKQDNIKRCLTCGRIIENPRKDQNFCGESKVGEKAAHKCRNTANNTKMSIEHAIQNPSLFDISEIIAPDKLKYLEYMKSKDCTDIIRKINHFPNNKNAI